MRRNTTMSRGSAIPAALLNAMQDEQEGLIRATSSNGAPALTGADGRHWCTPDAGVSDGTLVVVDATTGLDWRARLLWGTWTRLETAAQRLQGADAWQGNDVARPIAMKRFHGRTGTGGKGAGDTTVADGTPPVVASGSFAVIVDERSSTSQRVYLYARPGDHALCLYNASGATLHGELLVHGAGVSPTLGSPPPSPIPTLTDVLWLDPGLAADRPADPGGPAIYRSTDTGAVEIWDGGAWRSMGGGSSPTLAEGDLIIRGASADERLAIGGAGKVLTSNGTTATWEVGSPITTQGDLAIGDATGAPVRLAKGAEGKVLRAGATTVSWDDPPAPSGVAMLDAANVFTALQTLSVADGSGNNPTVCAVVRHTAPGGVGSWCGAAVRLEASDGVTPESIGALRSRKHSGTDGTLTELAPAYAGTLCPTGLRARATAASCINGVELIMGPSGTDPILQPCQETPPTDLGLTIQPIGTGVLRLKRPVVPSGTVADINGGTAPFNSPVAGQLAWATDATGGPTLAIYTGSAWVMATVSALA